MVVRVYHGAPDSKMPPNGTVMRIRCQCILHGCGMTKSINLIAPAFATMSAAISAVKPNEITRMCSMLMPNDAATSPPNTKPSGAVLQVLIVRPHCRECCSPTIPSHLVGRSSPHLETAPHDTLYDTNPPPQPLAKTCVVLGVCQTPTRWVTYIRSPKQNPSTHACAQPRGWWMLIFCCVRTQ